MKIKEVCEKTGLTKKAIRYYEEEGLFSPERVTMNFREYRDYTEKDLEELGRIAALRSLSFSIEEIRRMREDPETAPDIFRERQTRLQAETEENARRLSFYQSLDYTRRPFLDYVYTRLEEDSLWTAPKPKEKVAAPAFLVLLPGIASLLYPLGRRLLMPEPLRDFASRWQLVYVIYIASHILSGAMIGYVCLHGESFRRNRAAKISAWVWTLLLLVAIGCYFFCEGWGVHSYFLHFMNMENLYVILGGYLVLCFCLGGKGEEP